MRFVVIFGSQETGKVSNRLLLVLNVKAQTGTSFKERDNDRLIESVNDAKWMLNLYMYIYKYVLSASNVNSDIIVFG